MIVNEHGYLTRKGIGKKARSMDWFLGKPKMKLVIATLPKEYWGKRFKVKIEIIGGDAHEEVQRGTLPQVEAGSQEGNG